MYVVPIYEHGVSVIDDYDFGGSYCSTILCNLVEDIENENKKLNYFKILFLWDVGLGKYHHEMKLMGLEYEVMLILEDKLDTM